MKQPQPPDRTALRDSIEAADQLAANPTIAEDGTGFIGLDVRAAGQQFQVQMQTRLQGLSGTDRNSTKNAANRPSSIHMKDRCRGDLLGRLPDCSILHAVTRAIRLIAPAASKRTEQNARLTRFIPSSGQALQYRLNSHAQPKLR